jgi:hypothetical protein
MIFAIFGVANPTVLGPVIAATYPTDHYVIEAPGNEWLVSDSGTAKDVCDKLGITGGERGAAIVVGVRGYYGRKSTDLWEWMKAKLEATNGA